MTARPAPFDTRVTEPEHRALSTIEFVPLHNDRVIQQAHDFADELRLEENRRAPESVRAELISDMNAQILSGKPGFVSAWAKYGDRHAEIQQETWGAVEGAWLHPSMRAHILAALAKDDVLRQALCHVHADLNADGIALARGFKGDAL